MGKLFASMPVWSSSVLDSVLAVASPSSLLVSVLDAFIHGYCVFSSTAYAPLPSKAEQ